MQILNESKRDELLIPYLNILKEKGINISLGQFKTILLKKLGSEGGLHALSLGSNFYLAGAARYYFNGDLTLNKNLSIFNGEGANADEWNDEICKRLNALIIILRNVHIDSIGTQFEQPEDFGTLPINKLLRKYGSKINKELGIVDNKENKEEEVDRNPSVGKNYSFEIIYDYGMATKYERATSPMAWCVTYGETHFNYYQKNSKPASHLIVFRQDGWENINRQNGIDKAKWVIDDYNSNNLPRPHDPYANSLIAFFQSNESWKPADFRGAPLITSRWNHGANDTGSLEADRAYTLQEFMNITGISENDLQRIFEIWKRDNKILSTTSGKNAKNKELLLNATRALKYIQMRINGGENPENLLEVACNFNAGSKISKSLTLCRLKLENESVRVIAFIMDKGQIIFDSIALPNTNFKGFYLGGPRKGGEYDDFYATYYTKYKNCIICEYADYYRIYNIRSHCMLNIGGKMNFKKIPVESYGDSGDNVVYYEVKMGHNVISIVDSNTNMPLKLPNGEYWFEKILVPGDRSYQHREVIAHFIENGPSVYQITYDTSAKQFFFFSPITKKFIEVPQYNGEPWDANFNDLGTPDTPMIDMDFVSNKMFAVNFINNNNYGWVKTKSRICDLNGNIIKIDEEECVSEPRCIENCVITYVVASLGYRKVYEAFDTYTKKKLSIDGRPIDFTDLNNHKSNIILFKDLYKKVDHVCGYYIYDSSRHSFVKNPINFPSESMFLIYLEYGITDSEVICLKSNEYVPSIPNIPGFDWRLSHEERYKLIGEYYFVFDLSGELEYLPSEPVSDSYEKNIEPSLSTISESKTPSRFLLNESKRDELLIPYWNLMKQKGFEMSLGEFKTRMLKKLTAEGGMSQLSENSNYYLAGATRYYFNGDLTTNKQLSIFKRGEHLDKWNTEICTRLNALVKYLRNVHIDSVGSFMEQPEDFGTLSISKLLRKYGAKINKELGIEAPKQVNNVDIGPINYNVGKNYTFDIMFDAEDCKKYNAPTNPGHWCITSNAGYFRSYQRNSHGHFVIFVQKGWENIARKRGQGFPRDNYGKSLIAFMQSNDNYHAAQYGGGDFITSRWNHGYEADTKGCEADHAFTEEQFKQLTGISDEDLQKVYETWKSQKKKKGTSNGSSKRIMEMKEVIRSLKYIQMRINGGESPENLIGILKVLNGNGKPSKSVLECEYKHIYSNDTIERFKFIMDKNKIVLETLGSNSWENGNCLYRMDKSGDEHIYGNYTDCIIEKFKDWYVIYNMRMHCVVNVDGVTKFKSIPTYGGINGKKAKYYMVRTSTTNAALVSCTTNMPVKMPNGEYWCVDIQYSGRNYIHEREIRTEFFYEDTEVVEFITNDDNISYFFNINTNKFINNPKYNGEPWLIMPNGNVDTFNLKPRIGGLARKGLFDVFFSTDLGRWSNGKTYHSLHDSDGQIVNVGNLKSYRSIGYVVKDILRVEVGGHAFLYDLNKKGFIGINGTILTITLARYLKELNYLLMRGEYDYRKSDESNFLYIYDLEKQVFIKNPFNFPNSLQFYVSSDFERNHNDKEVIYGPIFYRNNNDIENDLYQYCKERNMSSWQLPFDKKIEWYKEHNGILNLIPQEELQYLQPDYFEAIPLELLGNDRLCAIDNFSENDVQQMVTEVVKRLLKF